MTDTIDVDALAKAQNWDPRAKKRLADEVRRQKALDIQLWYCDRRPTLGFNELTGRVEYLGCDGMPHEGYPYRHARAKQWPPLWSGWRLWLVMSGRGWGKTATGANWIRQVSNKVARSAMIGRRGVDVRATMVEGDSGLIYACEAAKISYDWQPSKKEFTFGNGHKVFGYSAEEPDSLRGPQHGAGWWDEPAHMPLLAECWSNYKFGLRLRGMPGGAKTLATSTPLPLDWLEEQMKLESTFVTRGSTFENEANLDPESVEDMRREFEGTRLGRQELYGEIIKDVVGALWNHELFSYEIVPLSGFDRIVVAIDPAGASHALADKTGIVVCAQLGDHYYVLEDRTDHYSPGEWSREAMRLYRKWEADAIVAEKNYGGDMVRTTIAEAARNASEEVRIIVTTATRSKQLRAEPIVSLYEQKRVHHLKGLEALEKEMVEWVPAKAKFSPNRIDALVWGMTELAKPGAGQASWARPKGRKLNPKSKKGPQWTR